MLEDVIIGTGAGNEGTHDRMRVDYAIRWDYMVCETLKAVGR